MTILKEEINTSLDSVVDLSRWRIIIIGIIAAAGLGASEDFTKLRHAYLALFIAPYVCAYVDLIIYDRLTVVHEIAKFLRLYKGKDAEMTILSEYEQFVQNRRDQGLSTVFLRNASIAMSLGIGSLVPMLVFVNEGYVTAIMTNWWVIGIPIIGLLISLGLFLNHKKRFKELSL